MSKSFRLTLAMATSVNVSRLLLIHRSRNGRHWLTVQGVQLLPWIAIVILSTVSCILLWLIGYNYKDRIKNDI